MKRRIHGEQLDIADSMQQQRSNYDAARTSRFRRRRGGLLLTGSSADYHYRNVFDYLKIMEYARDMDRNDGIVGQAVDRAVLNTIQNGLTVDPQTGDGGGAELNTLIKGMWKEWASDASQCDLAAEHTFTDIEELALRHMIVDGDAFVLPTVDGPLQFVEGHRVRTPSGTKRNVVTGILLDDKRKPVEYWITKDDIDPFAPLALVSDVDRVPAFDEEGNKNVFHVKRGKRKSQTRGISAFAPIFDLVGMHEDIQFAKLVQQQIASCFAIIRQRSADWKPGAVDPYGANWVGQALDQNRRIIEEIAPGFEVRGLAGEEIKGFSPNIPNAEFFEQMKTILQIIFLNLGLPLVMGLMDASDTNFSGWRGAVDQARMGFKRNQGWLIEHFHSPCYLWKLRQFVQKNSTLRGWAKKLGAFNADGSINRSSLFWKHEWTAPQWPYIQPLQDAQADQTRQKALLASPRRLQMERGQDWDEEIDDIVDDNGNAILKAAKKAKELSGQVQGGVHWREVLFLSDPEMLKVLSLASNAAAASAKGDNKESGPAPLNGLQISSAVDLIGKLRSGTIAPEVATELLVGMGIDRAAADKMVKATPAGAGGGDADKAFARDLVKTLAMNTQTTALVTNAIQLQPIIKMASIPGNEKYDEPYLPITIPAGQAAVSGAVVKDAEGSIVGGATVGGVADPATQNAAVEEHPAAPPPVPAGENTAEGAEGAETDDATGAKVDKTAPVKDAEEPAKKPAAPNDGDGNDPEDDPRDPEDKPPPDQEDA